MFVFFTFSANTKIGYYKLKMNICWEIDKAFIVRQLFRSHGISRISGCNDCENKPSIWLVIFRNTTFFGRKKASLTLLLWPRPRPHPLNHSIIAIRKKSLSKQNWRKFLKPLVVLFIPIHDFKWLNKWPHSYG